MMFRRPGHRMNRRGTGESGGARVPVFPLGDSLTLGFSGAVGADNAGGWRVQVRSPVSFRGPYNDFGLHAGVNGDQFADMEARFATDYVGNEATEIWLLGGANGVNDGLNATQVATALATLLDEIYSVVPATQVVRVFTNGFLDYTTGAKNAVLAESNRRQTDVVAADRAAGRAVVIHDVCGPCEDTTHLDGVDSGGLEHFINGVYGAPGTGTGYGLCAYSLDRYFSATADATMGGLTLEESYRASSISGATLLNLAASGSARDITLVNSPMVSAGINGVSRLVFNGTTQYGRSPTGYTIAQPSVIALVARPTAATGGPAMVDGATTTARQGIFCNTSNQIQPFAGTLVADTLVAPTTIAHCYIVVFNGASSTIYVDGVPRRVNINIGTQGGNGFTIAASAAATPSNFMAGDIYALDRLSGGVPTQAQVHAYMRHLNQTFRFWPDLGGAMTW